MPLFLFPGQGSQYPQMGRELYEGNALFRRRMDEGMALADSLGGTSLAASVYGTARKGAPFHAIRDTHPLILILETSLSAYLESGGIRPDAVLGYSVGEYAANVIAGRLSLEQGIAALVRQARLLSEKCPLAFMAAVLDGPEACGDFPLMGKTCHVASVNGPGHCVIAGPREAWPVFEAWIRMRGIFAQLLPVDYGFHSPLIDPIEKDFKAWAADIELEPARIPLVSLGGRAGAAAGRAADYLWDIVRRPVDFAAGFAGVRDLPDRVYLEVGPGGTLANFAKSLLPADRRGAVGQCLNPFGTDFRQLAKARELCGAAARVPA